MPVLGRSISSILDTRASKGIVHEFIGEQSSLSPETSVNQIILDMVRNDGTLTAAFDRIVEMATANGYVFVPKKNTAAARKNVELATKYFNDDLDFDQVQDNIILNLCIFQEAFVEKANKLKELHVLEATEIEPRYDKHGTITSYEQVNAYDSTKPEWAPNQVMYMQTRRIGSRVRSYKSLESVAKIYSAYTYGKENLFQFLSSLPPKIFYSLLNANQKAANEFASNISLSRSNPGVDIVAYNELKMLSPDIEFGLKMMEVIKFLRQEILMITGVPPIFIGIIDADGANRGNSEAQTFIQETRIMKLHQVIESHINKDLLPALGWTDIEFKYNPPSLKNEKQVLENAQKMRDIGANNLAVSRYLGKNGIHVAEDELELPVQKSKDSFPSRQRKGGELGTMQSNLDSSGTSQLNEKKNLNVRTDMVVIHQNGFEES